MDQEFTHYDHSSKMAQLDAANSEMITPSRVFFVKNIPVTSISYSVQDLGMPIKEDSVFAEDNSSILE